MFGEAREGDNGDEAFTNLEYRHYMPYTTKRRLRYDIPREPGDVRAGAVSNSGATRVGTAWQRLSCVLIVQIGSLGVCRAYHEVDRTYRPLSTRRHYSC